MEPTTPHPIAGDAAVAEEIPLEQLIAQARAEGNPWAQAAGIFKDDPFFDDWVEIMRENRRKADETPDYWWGFI